MPVAVQVFPRQAALAYTAKALQGQSTMRHEQTIDLGQLSRSA
jgi:hypothetical protein